MPDYNENVVHIVSTKDNTLKGDIPVGTNPHMVAFGDGGKYAYVTAEAGNVVTVIDTKKATVVDNIPVGETPVGIAASPDSKTIYIANYSAGEVSFLSVKEPMQSSRLFSFPEIQSRSLLARREMALCCLRLSIKRLCHFSRKPVSRSGLFRRSHPA